MWFKREAQLMAWIPLALVALGFVLAVFGPKLIRVFGHDHAPVTTTTGSP